MKKITYLFLFLLPFFSFSQETKKMIEQQFLTYTDLIVKKDFKSALDQYANEHFFEILPKEEMIKQFEILLNNPEMEFNFGEAKIDSLKVLDKKINNEFYAKIYYTQNLGMKINSLEEIADAKEKKEQVEFYLYAFKNQFGEDRVKYNEKTGFYDINSHKYCIANSANQKNWRFTVAEKNQRFFLEKFIPKELLEEVK